MLNVWKRSWKEKAASTDAEQDMLDGPGGSSSSLDSTVAAHPSDAALAEPSLSKRRLPDTLASDGPSRKKVRFHTSPAIEQEDLAKQVEKGDMSNISFHPPFEGFLITHYKHELSNELPPAGAVVFYEPATPHLTFTLTKELQQLNGSGSPFFQTYFEDSQAALDEVGCCASDLLWRYAFKGNDVIRNCGNETDRSIWESIQKCIKNWIFALPNLDITSPRFNVTHKFLMLVKALESCASYGDAFRGIVLVKRQAVALAIAEILRLLDGLVMFRPISIDWNILSPVQKQDISQRFRAGIHNVLIVTTCCKIELEATIMISFNTECLDFDEEIAKAARARVIRMVRKNEAHQESGRLFNRTRTTFTIECTDDVTSSTFIQDPTTCSRLYATNSVDAVNRFMFIGNDLAVPQVQFDFGETQISPSGGCLDCIITIPGVLRLIGPRRASKPDAKSAACFKLCQYLSLVGLLDCRFFPQKLPANTSFAQDPYPSSSDGQEVHPTSSDYKALGPQRYIRKEPDFWANAKDTTNTFLYPIIISTASPDGQIYAPVALLSRQPLPHLESFEIFHSGTPAIVSFRRCAPIDLEEARLHDLCRYTVRLCRALYNKPFHCSWNEVACLFAPLTTDWKSINNRVSSSPLALPSIVDYIHWELVQLVGDRHNTPIRMTTLQELENDVHDAVILDRAVEFTRKYFVVSVRPDMSPLSKPLDGSREAAFSSILDFTKSRMKTFEELKDIDQPLIEVTTVPPVVNHLGPISQPVSTHSHAKYLIPELCSKSTIPASVLRTARLLPCIMWRIDQLLLVKELNGNLFNHRVSEPLLHMSLCTPASGAEHDYERLEVLGDAFLKCLSSVYLYVTFPVYKEGQLHEARQNLISNRSLFQHACQTGIPNYIISKQFSTRLWTLPLFLHSSANPTTLDLQDEVEIQKSPTVSGSVEDPSLLAQGSNARKKKKRRRKQTSEERRLQWLGDKVVADVAEAILGAGYLTGGEETALQVAKALGIPFSGINSWVDFAKKCPPALNEFSLKPISLEAVGSIIGYKVKHSQLLSWALTHPSSSSQSLTFGRLEFMGDALLDFFIVRHLYEREQHLPPGGLTFLKAAMVSNSALAALCVCSGLHEHLVHNSQPLQSSIHDYVLKLKASQTKAYRDAEAEGCSPGQFWEGIATPKCLSDIVEAIIGAIYVGDNFCLEGVQIVFETLLRPFYERHITLQTLSHHPTKVLFELFQKHGCRRFAIENDAEKKKETVIAEVVVHNITLASAEGRDTNTATRQASFSALDALQGDSSFFARTCDCRIA